MSNYRDLHSDLPSRVFCLWQRTKLDASGSFEGLSVTAMLMAATAGFAMPWDVLKEQGKGNCKGWNEHPAFHSVEQKSYQLALGRCNAFLEKRLDQFEPLNGMTARHCAALEKIRDAAEYSENSTLIDLQTKDVRWAVKVLRNALSHSNIMTFGANANQIERLGFFAENRVRDGCDSRVDGWHVLVMPVKVFEQFLTAWFELLAPDQSFAAAATALADSK